MHRLMAAGRSQAAIAAELGLSRNTIRRFARAGDPGEMLIRDWAPHSPGILHDYEPYLQQRWNAGCANATLLWQEIRARGYPGGYSAVRDHLARFRGNAIIRAPAPKPPKPRAVTAWIMTRPGDLDPPTRPAWTPSWPAPPN